MNVLLNNFNTPFHTPPFDKIKLEDFKTAFEEALKLAKEEIENIASNAAEPTFENTIVAMEFSGEKLSKVSEIFFNLNSAETSDEMQALAQEISPQLSAFSNDVVLNPTLFARIQAVWNQREALNLDTDQFTLLEKSYLRFVRNGANCSEEQKARLREIDQELSKLSLTYGEHVLKETNAFELHLTNESDLAGIPDSIKEAAAQTAQENEKEGWIFTLHYPSYVPFMTYADNRDLREKMFRAYGERAFKDNENNNEQIILDIVRLRQERAQLLGYKSHADFVLERRMAQSADKVEEFLNYLLEKAKPFAEQDVKDVSEMAQKDGITDFQRWDFGYYSEKLRKEKFNLDDELLRPYFKLENVVAGVFETASKLYQIQFKERKDIPVYHPDVTAYEVQDLEGNHVAVFFADFFPRAGKRAGAWMTSYQNQYIQNGEEHRPHISIVCNFTKPTSTKPSLLTFNEVTTLFHEFGHALHGMLAQGRYGSITGTNVYWDFVELPSQVFENWCYEKECLDLFAKHYETSELIPAEYIERIQASAQFQEGYMTVRQISFGLLDMGWHDLKGEIPTDVDVYEKQSMSAAEVMAPVKGTNMSCQFSHIFQGGYSAGYYSYKWAEVLDADAFELFKEKGIFNPDVANAFKTSILAAGGSEHPMDLYKRFRGQEPDPDALLRRGGLL